MPFIGVIYGSQLRDIIRSHFFFFFLISTVWTGCVEYHFAHFPEFLIIDSERGRLDESEHFFADTTFETGEGGY